MNETMRTMWNRAAAHFQSIVREHDNGYPDALMAFLKEKSVLQPGDRVADIGCGAGKYALRFAELGCGLLLPGQDLKHHLKDCRRAAIFCATLGVEADTLIRRAESRRDMAKALALDCVATAAVETLCDRIELELQGQFPGCFFPFRYSPGYGDLPLEVQGSLLALLDAQRRVGLTATSTHILIPRKSVTAILGVADGPIERHQRSCLGCPARESCHYRKAGGHCGIS